MNVFYVHRFAEEVLLRFNDGDDGWVLWVDLIQVFIKVLEEPILNFVQSGEIFLGVGQRSTLDKFDVLLDAIDGGVDWHVGD